MIIYNLLKLLVALTALLFKCNKVIIRSPYHHSFIEYNKEEIQRIRLYLKKENDIKCLK